MFKHVAPLLSLLGLCMAGSVSAHEDVSPPLSPQATSEVRALMDPFFDGLRKGEIDQAYATLFEGTLAIGKTLEIQNLVSQTRFLLQTYGAVDGWTLGRSDCFTPTLCRAVFQVDADNGPMFVLVTLHRRDGGWKPTNIFVTDISTSLFD